ncbi:MAG: MogA/MoaB family molybdenum cofactor biosynthesis protein [Tractidigestivibacter sp.]|jgi:molybdopterin adenylyltransferase|uniref:MogA/MoaB family molybdenum cofactor biosynthesis protein n=1 Tax=Tractidigestivibacter sp. TaxID=2847320 RepID=UPI003D8EFB52
MADEATAHEVEKEETRYTVAVVTVSDRCSRGEREDASGPALVSLLGEHGYDVVATRVVPDDLRQIMATLQALVANDVALVVTTGGTGFSPRDVTPEATEAVCERMAPGIPEAMRAASMAITPRGCLSREVAGLVRGTLIVNLPGSPKAACENLSAVIEPIAHGLRMLRGGAADCASLS